MARNLLVRGTGALTEGMKTALKNSLEFIDAQKVVMNENALARSDAAQDLLQLLEEHPEISLQVSDFDKGLIHSVSRKDKASVLNSIPSLRASSAVRNVVNRDNRQVTLMTKSVLSHPRVAEVIPKGTSVKILRETAEEDDIIALEKLLPIAITPIEAIEEELNELKSILEPPIVSPRRGFWRSDKALAQSLETMDLNTLSKFERAVNQLEHMQNIAKDPQAVQPTLDEKLTYLLERRAVLAGIIRLTEDDVVNDVKEMQSLSREDSVPSLINALGILRFIRSTSNFKDVEAKYASASSRMQSGWKYILTTAFGFGLPSPAEAAELLDVRWQEGSKAFQTDNVQDQIEVLRVQSMEQQEDLEKEIIRLSEGDSDRMHNALNQWNESLKSAQDLSDIQELIDQKTAILDEVNTLSRSRSNVLMRLIYSVQVFLGFHL